MFEHIKAILVDLLGVDADIVTERANLVSDLAAESIDFLDLAYRIEQQFGLSDVTPAKIFPVFLREHGDPFRGGALAPEMKARLEREYPFLGAERIEAFEKKKKVDPFFDVSVLVDFVSYRQRIAA